MKFPFSLILFVFLVSQLAYSQTQGENYYVSSNSLNLRSEPNTGSEIITTIPKYSNLQIIRSFEDWAEVRTEGHAGYVHLDFINKGRAIVSSTSYRIGAQCVDGSHSNATGRGACSHHGGVARWLYKENKSVEIVQE